MEGNCKKCGSPRKSSSASLTQWIVLCQCDELESQKLEPTGSEIPVCQKCGKPVEEGRKGSFTQFIFRSSICSCKQKELKPLAPDANNNSIDTYISKPFIEEEDDEIDENLELDASTFPLERYVPQKLIGRGASGTVYKARDKLLNKKVAIKILHTLSPEEFVAFQDEAKETSKLNHPKIVQVLDFGATEAGTPYMVLDFFSGVSLEEIIKRQAPLNMASTIGIAKEVVEALRYSHHSGIFHRDIKPSNILADGKDFVAGQATVKLIDFGIAKSKNRKEAKQGELEGKLEGKLEGTLSGTPEYMSPDIFMGSPYTEASEVYSVGCVIYEMLTGKKIFQADTALDTLFLHANEPVQPVDTLQETPQGRQLESILMKCLEKEPEKRYATMDELLDELDEIDLVVKQESGSSNQYVNIFKQKAEYKLFGIAALLVVSCLFAIQYFQQQDEKQVKKEQALKSTVSKHRSREQMFTESFRMPELEKPNSEHFTETVNHYNYLPLKHIVCSTNIKAYNWDLLKDKSPFYLSCDLGSQIADSDLEKLIKIKNFKGLNAGNACISDKGLKTLCQKKDLLLLAIANIPTVSPKGLKEVNNLPHLRVLRLQGCNFDDSCLSALDNLAELTSFAADDSPGVTDSGIESLVKKDFHPMEVYLNGTSITDRSVELLSKIDSIKALGLRGTKITDRSAKYLGESKIIQLDIEGTAVSDIGLILLAKNKNLSGINTAGCSNISRNGLKRFLSTTGCKQIIPD